ncbi:hypothetical protein SAMN03159343_3119 [Klenkia marina]|uniref:Beta-lactamase enzyme family protein n=1 Tax=Klenkia marina TaxID=1960309 RepID=A0A1G4YME4_9ACTN|nr:hypothetical protein [Klenkia marina]SCX54661.1 hypothetical protein SAMN03159343_3119 [Klenkia marina]
MSRWGGRVGSVAVTLVAALLVEAETAHAAPDPRSTSAPAQAAADVVADVPVAPASPAGAALAAFGPTGVLTVAVRPVVPVSAPGTTADAVARTSAGSWSAGDIDRPVPTASLVKLYLAEGVLTAARASGSAVSPADLARIEATLTTSDDLAASELWVAHDGPALLADVVARYGLRGTTPPAPDPGAWGRSLTTASDLARFLVLLPLQAHPDDAALITGLLARAAPVGADGFDQSFGLLGPGRTADTAVKQGWMCCVDDVRHLHSAGVVDDEVVVLLAEFPVDVDWPTARAALDAAAQALRR